VSAGHARSSVQTANASVARSAGCDGSAAVSFARAGRVEDGQRAWEALFALWKDADPDLPVLVTGRREAREGALAGARRDRAARVAGVDPGPR